MTLEEEKELVAEKLMKWKIVTILPEIKPTSQEYEIITIPQHDVFVDIIGDKVCRVSDFNPQSDNDFWDVIHDKILRWTPKGPLYVHDLKKMLNLSGNIEYHSYVHDCALLTASPELRWKALIKALESK